MVLVVEGLLARRDVAEVELRGRASCRERGELSEEALSNTTGAYSQVRVVVSDTMVTARVWAIARGGHTDDGDEDLVLRSHD